MSELQYKIGFALESVFQTLDHIWPQLDPEQRPFKFLASSLIISTLSMLASFVPFYFALTLSMVFLTIFILSCFDLKPKKWDGSSSWLKLEFPIRTRVLFFFCSVICLFSWYIGWEYPNSIIPHVVAVAYPLLLAGMTVGLTFQARVMEQSDPRFRHTYQRVSRNED